MGEGRGIYSVAMFHVGASVISLAPTYFISQSALILLLLLSKSNPLRWASIWFFGTDLKVVASILFSLSIKMATPFGVAIFTGTAGNLIAHAE